MGVCKWRSIPALGALQTLTKSGRILLAHERLQMGQKMDVYNWVIIIDLIFLEGATLKLIHKVTEPPFLKE